MTRFFYNRVGQQMQYPVDVFIGKIRDYDGSRPSAIARCRRRRTHADRARSGGRSAGRKKSTAAPDRALYYPANTMLIGFASSPGRRRCLTPRRFGENLSTDGMTEHNVNFVATSTAGARR